MAGESTLAKPWALVAVAVLSGSGGAIVLPTIAPGVYRPEPFTAKNAAQMEEQWNARLEFARQEAKADLFLAKREAAIALRETEVSIRQDMPPETTKRRIEYLEAMCRRLGQTTGIECVPPSIGWADP